MSRQIFNPFDQVKSKETAVAAAAPENTEKELSTASALTNVRPDMCPKCGGGMCTAYLYDKTPVFYCDPCRVSHPKE